MVSSDSSYTCSFWSSQANSSECWCVFVWIGCCVNTTTTIWRIENNFIHFQGSHYYWAMLCPNWKRGSGGNMACERLRDFLTGLQFHMHPYRSRTTGPITYNQRPIDELPICIDWRISATQCHTFLVSIWQSLILYLEHQQNLVRLVMKHFKRRWRHCKFSVTAARNCFRITTQRHCGEPTSG